MCVPFPAGGEAVLDETASVPTQLRHERFVATPLTAGTAALDHESYMASPDVIRVHSDGRWPIQDFTLEDDLLLVARHEDDHEHRRAFTFVLLEPGGSRALGCLYLNPLRDYLQRVGADPDLVAAWAPTSAMVTFWLRQDEQDTDLADVVVEAVDGWLTREWPIAAHVFRVLPAERSSCAALERAGLRKVELALPGEPRPYLWFRPTG